MKPRGIPVVCGSVVALTLGLLMSRDYPMVGHDFRYFIPRLLDTDLHLRINGPTIQWYTPSFGGGLPAFANPQHLEYSIVQALLYVTSPWVAILLSTIVASTIGYTAAYRFLVRSLELEPLPSALGASMFVANGFYIEHLLVGHVSFQLFPLGALILYALTDTRRSMLANASVMALTAAMMLHHAGFYVLLLTAGSIVLACLLLSFLKPRLIEWTRLTATSAMAAVLFAAITGSKIYATLSFMRQFPREVADVYPVGIVQGLAGMAAQLAGGMTIVPMLLIARLDPSKLSGGLSKLTGASVQVGVWELDTGLSPVLWLFLAIGSVELLSRIRGGGLRRLKGPAVAAAVALAIAIWVGVEATLAKGLVYPYLRQLPVLRSLHVNHRVAAIFILPLVIAGSVVINRWYLTAPKRLYVVGVMVLTLAAPLSYLLLPAPVHLRTFDMTASNDNHRRIRNGERFPVAKILDVDDSEGFGRYASARWPWEPIFGYQNETFAPAVHTGAVREVVDGYLNMTNPSSLVFPSLNAVHPFERIPLADRDKLEALVARRQPDWKIPPVEHALNWLALAATALGAGVVLTPNLRKRPIDRR